jgi:hypothetical protein
MKRILLLIPAAALALASSLTAGTASAGTASTATASAATAPPVSGYISVSGHTAITTIADASNPLEPRENINSLKCLGITGGEDDAPAVQWTCNAAANQGWKTGSCNSAGWCQIVNGDGECLGIAGGSASEGAQVVGWTCLGTGHPDQYWGGIPINANWDFAFENYHSRMVLGVAGGSTAQGAAVVQWPFTNAPNQWWYCPDPC